MIYRRFTMVRDFLGALARYLAHVGEVIFALLLSLVFGGIAISYVENIRLGDAIYFAFVTGLSIGYGDITPHTVWGHLISISIGFVGMVFVGISAAIATRALADVTRKDSQAKF
jgi:hypothetical protein